MSCRKAHPDPTAATPTEQTWCPRQMWLCRTCEQTIGGLSRGWTQDSLDSEVALVTQGHPRGHDLVAFFGDSPDSDQDTAQLHELWWEHYACQTRSAEQLAGGNPSDALHYAINARGIQARYPQLVTLHVELGHDAD